MNKLLFFILLFTTLSNAQEPILPIPKQVAIDLAKAKLGQELFIDTAFSSDGSTSCLSCHNIYEGGADTREVSLGVDAQSGDIHSPTVLNARYNFRQFWNARAKDLKEQVDGPIHNPVEHNMDTKLVEKALNDSASYRAKFQEVYGVQKILYSHFVDAIVAFENALTTPNAKFDRYLRGEIQLSEKEKEGYTLFKQNGCITCHNGVNIGGNSLQKMGTFKEYKTPKIFPDRSFITKKESHKNVFKVPTLRNIALTAPYFHDASAKTLEEAVETMSHFNLGIRLSKEEIDSIVLFLNTLTGDRPAILESH
ncbi:MAG: cytochrome c peroxidase [Sulfurimonas sp.]|jgi:cytochrome c peroxidase|nr:cytochrome c peroxidase [Sulfurimonas sp.]